MNQTKSATANRILFFDNLRYLMVLLVLIFHSAASYSEMVAFWPFHEVNTSHLLDIIVILLDVFMMIILFFIAGYFALPSLQKKGGRRFLKSKFRRLGIPWLMVTIFVLPVLDYIHYYTQSVDSGLQPRGYATHWLLSMKRIAEFRVGAMNMSEYLDMTEHFYQRYMWFLSLLLLFFVVFALLYEAKKKWLRGSERSVEDETPSNESISVVLLWFGILTVLLFAPVYLFTSADPPDMSWFSLGNIIQFQPAKLVLYISYFGLGVYAYSRRWFTNGTDFGRLWVWGLICFLLMVGNMLVGRSMVRASEPSLRFHSGQALGLQLAFVVLYPIWTLSFLGVFTAFAVRRWNRSTPFNRELASNSYNMYLVHYVFAMTLPLLLSVCAGGPVLVKFGVVALATVLLSYGVSRYIIKPYPRLVVIGLGGLSVLMAVFT